MNEIKEGEYIRTTQGFISKVEYIEEDMIMCESVIYCEYEFDDVLVDEQMKLVTKHSFNILDLIEEGDYINGHYVQEILRKKDNELECMLDSDYECSTIIENADIKTIVTKEQFNSVMYKVVE